MATILDKAKNFPEKGTFVKKGTTIIEAEPFVAVLSPKFHSKLCDNCFKKCEIFRCSGCHYVHYCSKKCQKNSWKFHKLECVKMNELYPTEIPSSMRLMVRIIKKLQNGEDKERGYYSPTEYRTFKDLMSHYDEIKANINEMNHFTVIYGLLGRFFRDEEQPSTREVLEIYGRMRINSFHILDNELKAVGVGIYLGPSIIDHSCRANTSTDFDGTTLTIRTLCDIPSFDWSKVFVSYIDVMQTVEERRAELRNSYYFWCHCERCDNPEPASNAACPNVNCTNPCSPRDLKCGKCDASFPPNFEDDFELVEFNSHRNLKKMKEMEEMEDAEKLEICRMCLKEQEGLLHPLNILHVRTIEMALQIASELELWSEAKVYARKLMHQYVYYYGDSHPVTAALYWSLKRLHLQP